MFLLEVAKGVQELHKRFTKAVANRDLANVCSDTHRREGRTDNQERSKEDEQGSEVSLHQYGRGEKLDALILGA